MFLGSYTMSRAWVAVNVSHRFSAEIPGANDAGIDELVAWLGRAEARIPCSHELFCRVVNR